MADGTRKRRHSPIRAKRRWYARHRSKRFALRFGGHSDDGPSARDGCHQTLAIAATAFKVETYILLARYIEPSRLHWEDIVRDAIRCVQEQVPLAWRNYANFQLPADWFWGVPTNG